MNYCSRCILPDTPPGIWIDDEGICSGCRGQEYKDSKIDWVARGQALEQIAAEAKARANSYDCIVPVSGGKDSWYQVIKCQELGLKPLAVTWRTPARTELGRRNLDGMVRRLGVDHIDYTIDPDVERRFMKLAFVRAGDPGLPMHMALFTIPTRLAVQLRIPLVVWGENPQLEFGGSDKERLATDLDAEWLSKHGCMQGTKAEDWVGEELSAGDLVAYELPSHNDYVPKSIFLGAFLKWNSFEIARLSQQHGFRYESGKARTGSWDFADVDCDFISLHHFPKWHKFGMTRTFDNLSVQIRYGMLTRDQAIAKLREIGLQVPHEDIEGFCRFVGEPETWFWDTIETLRDHDIWFQENGAWKIHGFLIEDWEW